MRTVLLSSTLGLLFACSSNPPSTTGSSTSGTTGTSTTSGTSGTTSATTSSASSGSTTGAIAGLDNPCGPANQPDICLQYGLSCQQASDYLGNIRDGGEGGNCGLPGELQGCQTAIGCGDSSLSCIGITGTTESACSRICTSNGACPVPYTTCQPLGAQGQSICFYNFCVSPPPLAQSGSYYGACNASQSGQGTCVPIENLQFGVVGLCIEAGSGPDGGACSAFRDGGICGVGLACDQLLFGLGGGICREVCAFSGDAGPSCPTGQVCANGSSLGIPTAIDWGVCMNPCGTVGQSCPAGEQCYAPGGFGHGGLCLP